MTKEQFRARMAEGPLILDGATGSNLIAAGMPRGVQTELWVLEHPEPLLSLQRAYVEAGAEVLYAPTFQATRLTLGGRPVPDVCRALTALSKQAADGRALVAGDLTTTGRFAVLEYDELYGIYAEQLAALRDAGVDLLVAETLLYAEEAAIILDAAADFDLPVLCSLTVEADGSLLFGGNVFDAAADLAAMGAAAVGVNCSCGPDQLVSVVAGIRERVSVPVLAKPNAGLPEIGPDGLAAYPMGPEAFAGHMLALRGAGAAILGGCCGTTPAHLRAMREALKR